MIADPTLMQKDTVRQPQALPCPDGVQAQQDAKNITLELI